MGEPGAGDRLQQGGEAFSSRTSTGGRSLRAGVPAWGQVAPQVRPGGSRRSRGAARGGAWARGSLCARAAGSRPPRRAPVPRAANSGIHFFSPPSRGALSSALLETLILAGARALRNTAHCWQLPGGLAELCRRRGQRGSEEEEEKGGPAPTLPSAPTSRNRERPARQQGPPLYVLLSRSVLDPTIPPSVSGAEIAKTEGERAGRRWPGLLPAPSSEGWLRPEEEEREAELGNNNRMCNNRMRRAGAMPEVSGGAPGHFLY